MLRRSLTGWAGLAVAVLFVGCTGAPTASPASSAKATPSAGHSPTPTAPPVPVVTPTPTMGPTPTPRPTSIPTPKPTATPGQTPQTSPTPSAASTVIRHGPRTSNDVALTFDMGGRVGDALAIMNWLLEHEVRATIFMTGAMADNQATDAGRQVLAIIDTHPELFTLGNHSYTHTDFRNLDAGEIAGELARTEAAIAPYCSQDPRPYFRPPNGGYDGAALAAIEANHYPYAVLWDIDTIDWRKVTGDPPGPTADRIVAKVLANARGGSIVLMHLGGYETFEALPRIVDGLRDAGFDLVNLDAML